MHLLTRVHPTILSIRVACGEGEKSKSKENEAAIECPNFNS